MNDKQVKVIKVFTVILLLGTVFFNIGNVLFQQKDKYLSHTYWQRYPGLKSNYYNSIYANKKGNWVPDEVLYAFNGGALITGVSPILVNPEVPPVGKYLIGISAVVFNNENIIIVISAVVSLFILFLLGKQVFSSSLVALIPLALVSSEPIFLNQLIYTPLLDIIHLQFLLLTLYFFNCSFKHKKHTVLFFLLSSLSLGLFIATKFFAVGVTIVAACFVVLVLRRDMYRLKRFILTFPLAVFILFFSYIRVLIIGYPFNKFLGIQKWVLWYNQGHVRSLFSMWPLLLLNKWYASWNHGRVLSDSQWRITWPIITICSLSLIVTEFYKRFPSKPELQVLMAWVMSYCIFLSIGDASARYFVILIPLLYILSVYFLEAIVLKIMKTRKIV